MSIHHQLQRFDSPSLLQNEPLLYQYDLDSIVANGYNISRNHAKQMIEHDLVRVNWTDINKPDYVLAVNDLVSVRKYGRLKIDELNGLTKKDKWRITMAVIKK